MKKKNLLLLPFTALVAACTGTVSSVKDENVIEKSDIKIENQRLTPEALWAMGRIGGVSVSPNEKQIA